MMLARELTAGDIVIFRHHTAPHLPWHTAIVASNPNFMIHADGENVVKSQIADMDGYTIHQPDVYRSYSLEWAAEAARIAGVFQTVGVDYSADRARGVDQQKRTGIVPQFEFDALYRSLKWAQKKIDGNRFSVNKGTTCSAFVSACYQAAKMIRLTNGNRERIQVAYDYLSANRVDKVTDRDARVAHTVQVNTSNGLRTVRDYYTRGVSNVGFTAGPNTLTDHWNEVYRLLTGAAAAVIAPAFPIIFTAGLTFDAKFIYTSTLHSLLSADTAGWYSERLVRMDPNAQALEVWVP